MGFVVSDYFAVILVYNDIETSSHDCLFVCLTLPGNTKNAYMHVLVRREHGVRKD